MTLHKLWNHFAKFPYQEDAELNDWRWLIFRNYDNTIKIIVALSKNLKCLICDDLSLNFNFKSSLAEHYRGRHTKTSIANYTIEKILNKDPDELGEEIQEMIRNV